MLLSQALIDRKNASKSLGAAISKYVEVSVVKADESTPKRQTASIDAVMSKIDEYWNLSIAINLANQNVHVGKFTMMEAINHRDRLKSKIVHLDKVIEGVKAALRPERYSTGQEVPKANIGTSLQGMDAMRNEYAKELRELDFDMQKVNWSSEI